MVKIVPSHPHLIAEHQDMLLASLNDQDISIRMRALDLVSAMVRHNLPHFPSLTSVSKSQIDEQNVEYIVQELLSHLVSSPQPTHPPALQSLSQHTSPSPPQPTTS